MRPLLFNAQSKRPPPDQPSRPPSSSPAASSGTVWTHNCHHVGTMSAFCNLPVNLQHQSTSPHRERSIRRSRIGCGGERSEPNRRRSEEPGRSRPSSGLRPPSPAGRRIFCAKLDEECDVASRMFLVTGGAGFIGSNIVEALVGWHGRLTRVVALSEFRLAV